MAGIFSGMEAFGLGNMTSKEIFAEPQTGVPNTKQQVAKKKVPTMKEEDFLFEKTYECPVCGKNFKEHTLRTGKARLLKTDMDLRPTFEGIEPLKYDVVQCKECGFTALTRYFVPMTVGQRKLIAEKITANFTKPLGGGKSYSYEEAVGRYKLALVNAIVKNAKASEKAYICLRGGWLCRSYVEHLMEDELADSAKIKEINNLEEEFIKNAYEGFVAAQKSESFPMCGMDESTMDYLLATLATRLGDYAVASKLISKLLLSPSCNSRVKDKVRDLKEELLRRQKES